MQDVQNFQNILRPTVPLIPEMVRFGPHVQDVGNALQHMEDNSTEPRRSARIKAKEDRRGSKVDYKALHGTGTTG